LICSVGNKILAIDDVRIATIVPIRIIAIISIPVAVVIRIPVTPGAVIPRISIHPAIIIGIAKRVVPVPRGWIVIAKSDSRVTVPLIVVVVV
jgi:hypothetical protein